MSQSPLRRSETWPTSLPNGASQHSGPVAAPDDTAGQLASLEAKSAMQAQSLQKLMGEWDDLADWAQAYSELDIPRKELLEKLQLLRPF